MMEAATRRILLVDDHPAVRRGLALLLEEARVGRCFEAAGCREALEIAGRESPDVALVDLSMGREETMALLAELHERRIPVLICSASEQPDRVRDAMEAGARGYITKGEAGEIVRAVRGVLAGWVLISPRAAEGLEAD